jgi:hypothetical protein
MQQWLFDCPDTAHDFLISVSADANSERAEAEAPAFTSKILSRWLADGILVKV